MSHEPGRERHMIHKCENCGRVAQEGELTYVFSEGEYWCEGCINDANETAYERQQAADLESPPESARAWEEHQKAHKR